MTKATEEADEEAEWRKTKLRASEKEPGDNLLADLSTRAPFRASFEN